jgi:hypothetical protein
MKQQNPMQVAVKIGRGTYALDVPVKSVVSRKIQTWQQIRRNQTAKVLNEQRGSDSADSESRTRSDGPRP